MTQAQCVTSTCNVHTGEDISIYCHRCRKPICLECTKYEHASHEFDTISKVRKLFCEAIPNALKENTDKMISKRRRDIDSLSKMQKVNSLRLEDATKRIDKNREQLKHLIDSRADKMMLEMKTRTEKVKNEIHQNIEILQKQIKEMEDVYRVLADSSATLSNTVILEMKHTYEDSLYQNIGRQALKVSFQNDLHYIDGEIDQEILKRLQGTLLENDPSRIRLNEETSFVQGDDAILSVQPVCDHKCWVQSHRSRNIQLLNMQGRVLDTKEIGIPFDDFIVLDDGSLIYIITEDYAVRKVDTYGKTSTILNAKPLKPRNISLTLGDDFLVIMVDVVDYKLHAGSRRVVQQISRTGDVIATHEFDRSGSRLFVLPYKVRQNYNGDICVVQGTRKGVANVVILKVHKGLKIEYSGQILKHPFLPQDVCCDKSCNILVNDLNNKAIHFLDPAGNFIKYLTENLGVRPLSLGLHKFDLWIGANKGQLKIFNYKYE